MKKFQESEMSVKITKENVDIVSNVIFNNFSNSLFSSSFPLELKNADVKPIVKTNDRNNAENYRPLCVLPNLCKVYERCVYNQMYEY